MQWNRDGVRHLAMRLGLGFVMCWFGVQELRNPSEWTVFVPSFVSDISPIAVNDLVLLHGFLLVLAAGSVVLGLFYLPGAVLSMGLLAEILGGLWIDSGFNDLVVRDIGLLGLAIAVAADPVRSWHLESVLSQTRTAVRSTRRRAERDGGAIAAGRAWPTQVGAAGALVAVVLTLGFALNATGGSGSTLPNSSASVLSQSSGPTPTPAPPSTASVQATPAAAAPTAAAQPTAAPTVKFDDWRYKRWSYQVYPGEPSADAQKALAGFDLSVQDEGDHVVIYLKALSTRYRDAQQTVAKGTTAYFVETSMRDDPASQENDLDDDGLIVVNADGYILRS